MENAWTRGTIGMERDAGATYAASYGGGLNSTAMIVHILREGLPLDRVVFADTGDEIPETYAYLGVMRRYLRRRGLRLDVVRTRSGRSLMERCAGRGVIPSQVWRWCTRDVKVAPVHAYYRAIGGHVYQYMGIDHGEARRMKPPAAPYVTNLYPLVDSGIGRDACEAMVRRARLPVPPKSGCHFCPFNSMRRWREIWESHPDLYAMAVGVEESNKHFPRQTLAPDGHTLRGMARAMSRGAALPDAGGQSPCGGECAT